MRRYIDLAESLKPWPDTLNGLNEITDYILDNTGDDVDPEYVYEYVRSEIDRNAVAHLKLVPINNLRKGSSDTNVRSASKQKRYKELPLHTMPPILVIGNEILDGHHRFREAKRRGETNIWAYVIDEPLSEGASPSNVLDGWWITESGEMIQCDHVHDYHHADIAISELGLEDETGDEDEGEWDDGDDEGHVVSGGDDWFRGHAIDEALRLGWVRCSIYDRAISLEWRTSLSAATKRTLLTWIKSQLPLYTDVTISAPNQIVTFGDEPMKAYRFIRQNV